MYIQLLKYSLNYNRKLKVHCFPHILFSVVSQTEKYSNFIPWCTTSVIVSRESQKENHTELKISFTPLYTLSYVSHVSIEETKNTYTIKSLCQKDPLQYLESKWVIYKNTTNKKQTLADYQVKYKFVSRLYDNVSGMLLNYIGEQMCQTFIKRALSLSQEIKQNIINENYLNSYLLMNKQIHKLYKENQQFTIKVNEIALKLQKTQQFQKKLDFQIKNLMIHQRTYL